MGEARRTLVPANLASIMERVDEALLPAMYREVGEALHATPTGLGALTLCRSFVQAPCYPLVAYAAVCCHLPRRSSPSPKTSPRMGNTSGVRPSDPSYEQVLDSLDMVARHTPLPLLEALLRWRESEPPKGAHDALTYQEKLAVECIFMFFPSFP